MALVIGLSEGEDFYIDDVRMVVDEICTNRSFWVTHPSGDRHFINDRRSVEISPRVMASAGKGSMSKARLAISAPLEIAIVRGELMRMGQ